MKTATCFPQGHLCPHLWHLHSGSHQESSEGIEEPLPAVLTFTWQSGQSLTRETSGQHLSLTNSSPLALLNKDFHTGFYIQLIQPLIFLSYSNIPHSGLDK